MAEIDLTKKAETLLHDWQLRLGLLDWDITVKVVSYNDIQGWGCINWNLTEKAADMKLMHPDDASPDAIRPYDIEATLVHELLHLHFAPFAADAETLEETFQEQAINALSRTLVKLQRS